MKVSTDELILYNLREYKWKSLEFFHWLFFIGVLFVTRFYLITERPLHHDETINGWFVIQMWREGFYKYDPANYHGPLWFYLLQLSEAIWGDGSFSLRSVPAFINILQFGMLGLWVNYRKATSAWWVLWAWALSPAVVFYSRYAIHETLFVFTIVMFFVGIAEYFYYQNKNGIYLLWMGFLGAFLTKETFVIILISIALSFLLSFFLIKKHQGVTVYSLLNNGRDILKNHFQFFLYSTIIFFLFYSGNGQYGFGGIDFFKAFLPWMKTGTKGAGHEKSFIYWLNLFYSFEWTSLLFLFGTVALSIFSFFKKEFSILSMSLFSIFIFLIFSIIPYKTPWNIITIQIGFFLTAMLLFSRKFLLFSKWASVVPLFSLYAVYNLNYQRPSLIYHSYVYVHTSNELKEVIDEIERVMQGQPSLWGKEVVVLTQESWPLPWYLRNFAHLIYKNYQDGIGNDTLVGFVDESKVVDFEKKSIGKFWKRKIQVRDARELAWVYFNTKYFPPHEKHPIYWESPSLKVPDPHGLPLRLPSSEANKNDSTTTKESPK